MSEAEVDEAKEPGQTGSGSGAGAPSPMPVSWLTRVRRWWPRPEMTLLAISLVGTIAAKAVTARQVTNWNAGYQPDDLYGGVLNAALADLAFFAGVAVVFALAYAARPGRLVARGTLVAAAGIAVWSIANAGWLRATSAQLQPSILMMAAEDFAVTWEVVVDVLTKRANLVAVPILVAAACGLWFAWRLWRPVDVERRRRRHVVRAAIAAGVLVVAATGRHFEVGGATDVPWKDAIAFSSHWYALGSAASSVATRDDVIEQLRVIPRAGERTITLPAAAPEKPPNVVIIYLESVSRKVTTLNDPSLTTTPTLARLASEGVEFTLMRTPIPETTKAWWTSLTSTRPDFLAGAVESVLVDEPYESLATVLRRRGYRSGFFQMSRGAWFGAPGFWSNLGYDWAWFRENLQDESAYLGWVNGDDFRMIEPMFEWVDASDEPFLLTMITSVTHDPYVLPDWYEHEPKTDVYDKYLQTIEFSDAFVQAVFDELEKRGIADDTLLCVLGDHGEVFRPDARRGRWVVYEELLHVPWVLRWPGHIDAGTTIDWPASHLDLMPTILTLLGYGIDDAGFEGLDAFQPIPEDRRLFFTSWFGDSPKGYIEGHDKYLYFPYTRTLLHYDLEDDPGELTPVTIDGAERDEIVARIRAWERESNIVFPAQRFRERLLFDHWQTFSTGRVTNAYYVP